MARILIIDDDTQLLRLLAIIFGKHNYDVITAENGAVGLRLLEQSAFDVVVTDIVMPEKDGIEVITALSSRADRPIIIAMSGGSQRLEPGFLLSMAKVLKVDAVLAKPLSPLALLETVETMLLTRNATVIV